MGHTKIQEVSVFVTEDGKKFDTRAEADQYLITLDLKDKMSSSFDFQYSSLMDIAEWIVENLDFTFKVKRENENV